MIYIARNILFLRKKTNKTQAEIQDQLDVKRNTWSNWENGLSYPDYPTLIKIATFFNVDLGKLITVDLEKEDQTNPEKSAIPTKNNTKKAQYKTDTEPFMGVSEPAPSFPTNQARVLMTQFSALINSHTDRIAALETQLAAISTPPTQKKLRKKE